jgi:hypothetical protein
VPSKLNKSDEILLSSQASRKVDKITGKDTDGNPCIVSFFPPIMIPPKVSGRKVKFDDVSFPGWMRMSVRVEGCNITIDVPVGSVQSIVRFHDGGKLLDREVSAAKERSK